ncbi:MAG: MFS transporter [Actinobacteria bacterium]|nr:MFS transporter [Actinomycetota bacterium]
MFANPDLRRLQLASAGSILGAWSYVVALYVFAYQEDGAFAIGLLGLVRWLTAAAVAPAAGVLGDRYSRTLVMIASDLTRAAAIGAMALAVVADAPSMAVYALAVVGTVAATPFAPAQAALLPDLARTPQQLTAANASSSTIDSAGTFVGPALGGLLLAATSTEVVFAATAGLFLWSALNVARIGRSDRASIADRDGDGDEDTNVGGWVRESLAGFRTIAAQPGLRLLVALLAAHTFVDGAVDVLIVVLALETLDLGASGVGFLNSAGGVGGLAAAVVAGALAARGRLATDLGIGVALSGVPILLIGIWPEQALALVLMAAVGAGATIVSVAGDTLLQRAAPREVLARVFGVLDSVLLVSVALGAIAAPVLVTTIGMRWTLIAVGSVLPLLALLSWRRLVIVDDATAAVPERLVELLAASPIFAPLPRPTLELLARTLEERRVPAGELVFRQGEPGDEFFLIESGTADTIVDGFHVRQLGPGESFGEIALLRDTTRTATVAARSDLLLQVLDRDDFLGAVTGHPESAAAADTVVGARLGGPSPASL